ncbi:MAG: hypothetical protein D6731_07900 [Planctomycetota bacterium]|nr:MAG: hypothetical protein D6731_07900 [Planctomycetota bacterium]
MSEPSPFARAPRVTASDLQRLQRTCDQILREFGLALERGYLRHEPPQATIQRYRSRLAVPLGEIDRGIAYGESSAEFLRFLAKEVRGRFDELAERAKLAHEYERSRRSLGDLQSAYNRALGNALAGVGGPVSDLARREAEQGVDALVDAILPDRNVRSEQRADFQRMKEEMKGSLKRWLLAQSQFQDALYFVEAGLLEVAGYLYERLSVQGQLEDVQRYGNAVPLLSPQGAKDLDRQAGAIARRARRADEQAERRLGALRPRALQVATRTRFDAKLVLDPARRFLDRVSAEAGIRLTRGSVRVDLSSEIVVIDPLVFDERTRTEVTTRLQAEIGSAWTFSAEHLRVRQRGRGWEDDEFNASLRWARGAGSASIDYQSSAWRNHVLSGSFTYDKGGTSLSASYSGTDFLSHTLGLDASRRLNRNWTLEGGYGGTYEGGRWGDDTLRLGLGYRKGDLSASAGYELREGRDYEVKLKVEFTF